MDIVKKNLVSIIFGVIALLVFVAVFLYPLDGYFEDLKQKVTKRADIQRKVDGLLNKPRNVPVFNLNSGTTVRLPKFPGAAIIKVAKGSQDRIHSQSERVYGQALQMNHNGHDQVVQGTLPMPLSQPIALDFRAHLQDALDKLRTEDLVAGIPPTDEEFKKRSDELWKSMEGDLTIVDGVATNAEQVKARYEEAVGKLRGVMQQEMATKKKMYVNPATVMKVPASIPNAADGKAPDPASIWWAQVAFWITNDVALAIKEVNASSTSVTTSPVKNLLALEIPETFFPQGNAAMAAAGTDAGATPATGGLPDATIAITENPAATPTKRVSNNLFDVVQFGMALDIEADKIPLFLKTLATNRFITVTRFELFPVDSQLHQINGYVYGSKPVVTLKLDCEALFMREWTLKLMPKTIRDLLGIPDQAPGTKL